MDVDALPSGPKWNAHLLTIKGDRLDEDGNQMTEEVELWHKDPVEVIKELMGNPAFKDHMAYAPEKVFETQSSMEEDCEVWNEMNTGSWWWETQVRCRCDSSSSYVDLCLTLRQRQLKLPVGATVAPIILSSDKTKLSQFRGDKSAWPVYLTIGNIILISFV